MALPHELLAMSVKEEYEDFFRAVANLLPLESDQGPVTVPEYLEHAPTRTDGSYVVYYITERGSVNQYFLLANARSIRVFNCADPFAERFLQRYAEIWPERVHLIRLDVAISETIFEQLTDEQRERFAELQAAYHVVLPDSGITVRACRFKPTDVPAVLTETHDSKNRRKMAEMAANLELPESIRDIVKGFLGTERDPLTLQLNVDNPTIQRLAAQPNLRDEVNRHALISLYNNAALLRAHALRVQDVQIMFSQYNKVIELMLFSWRTRRVRKQAQCPTKQA